ncbi:hypothetical protein DOE78_20435 [Bacillus sp. Y1]|nr:hypothetical protein [Bacillus sp. Y1]AYA77600.1 hypothetical protein DOE78_20435 [Bacillus sp. Y1]
MRINNSLKNISIGILSQIVIILLGFVSRKVLIDNLNINYLGINGLLTNIFSVMVLVEGGIGISIVYNLYKPLAENNKYKVIALVQLYKRIYSILALIVVVFSLALFPFLGGLIKDEASINNLTIVYFLFVAKSVISYLNAHKWSLINADQKGYVIARTNLYFQIITTLFKIVVLVLTKNFIFYLLLELFLYIIQNIVNGRIVNTRYSYIKTKEKHHLEYETKVNLKTNVKAMFLHNFGGFLVFGVDNLLISSFIGLAAVGIYSNYTMVINQATAVVNSILGGIGASVGNLIATETIEKNYSIFKVTFFINFWIYSIVVIFLFNVLGPFISWWLGKAYVLDNITFIFIIINLYLLGMRTSIATFKNKAGLFTQDKYIPILEGLINLVVSIILVKSLGLVGIFIGTMVSTILTVFFSQPIIVYKHLFKKPVHTYFVTYSYYTVLTVTICYITSIICQISTPGNSLISLIVKGLVCIIVPNLIYIIIFNKKDEFGYLLNVISSYKEARFQKRVKKISKSI